MLFLIPHELICFVCFEVNYHRNAQEQTTNSTGYQLIPPQHTVTHSHSLRKNRKIKQTEYEQVNELNRYDWRQSQLAPESQREIKKISRIVDQQVQDANSFHFISFN